jgi:anti-sigma B factor antagonist
VKLSVDSKGDVIVMAVKGNLLGGPDAELFYNEVKRLLGENHRQFALDLSGVKLINSSGLGILIKALKPVREAGGDFHLAAVSEKIDSLFMITKLYQVFKSFDTVDQAVQAF